MFAEVLHPARLSEPETFYDILFSLKIFASGFYRKHIGYSLKRPEK